MSKIVVGNGEITRGYFEVDCDMAEIPWYHCLTWWFRDYYPWYLRQTTKSGTEIFYKRFKTRWLAMKYIDKRIEG